MSISKTYSVQTGWPKANLVEIQTEVRPGFPLFTIIGLGDTAVQESKRKILSAVRNNGYGAPKSLQRKILTLLRPSSNKKTGSIHDLAIAYSYMEAMGYIASNQKKVCCLGELTLEGEVVPCPGIIQAAAKAIEENFSTIFLPHLTELHHLCEGRENVIFVRNLKELSSARRATFDQRNQPETNPPNISIPYILAEALMLSICGKLHLLISGEPGVGKSFSVKHLAHIIPNLNKEDRLSRANLNLPSNKESLLRTPHHTVKLKDLLGNRHSPGEITLSHKGFLLADEIGEWSREAIEALRQPLQEGIILLEKETIACDFTLIGTLNPCKCGYRRSLANVCTCTQQSLRHYQEKFSHALLERIPLKVGVNADIIANQKLLPLSSVKERAFSLEQKIQKKGNWEHAEKLVREELTKKEAFNKLNVRCRANIIKIATLLCLDLGEDRLQTALGKAIRYQLGSLFD